MRKCRRWTKEEIAVLRGSDRSVSDRLLAERLGRSWRAVSGKRLRLGVRKILGKFTAKEDAIIWAMVEQLKNKKHHFHKYPVISILAKRLGRSPKAVADHTKELGISFRKLKASGRHAGRKVVGWRGKKYGSVPIYEHVANMEQHLGRSLRRGEVVHHVDLDKENNESTNLFLCRGRAEHRRFHCQLERIGGELVRRGIIRFNRSKRIYELCAMGR